MTWLGAIIAPQAFPDHRLIVGLEDDPDDGSLRIYVGARYTGVHTHCGNQEQIEKVRRAYGGGHLFAEIRADALCNCHPELTPALRNRSEGNTDAGT